MPLVIVATRMAGLAVRSRRVRTYLRLMSSEGAHRNCEMHMLVWLHSLRRKKVLDLFACAILSERDAG